MNLGKQISAHRKKMGLSQDNLAAKIYVSRQTISNWETRRSYPDVENLLLLSTLFGTSLDELVKGDVPQMKQKISQAKFDRDAHGMLLFLYWQW
ncbi:helix-turn-helix transcriptional regulator [Loigolactobacillus coryniformis]|uniref:helix-turn-helix transcriptional regulator n=1 Tax=Loigolactobacillus coryniformis TaxID=1610 RepID=UPI00021959B0|nr:helix-turn-helix transcriptional regulator [Loigolactobacillus coryniformis]